MTRCHHGTRWQRCHPATVKIQTSLSLASRHHHFWCSDCRHPPRSVSSAVTTVRRHTIPARSKNVGVIGEDGPAVAGPIGIDKMPAGEAVLTSGLHDTTNIADVPESQWSEHGLSRLRNHRRFAVELKVRCPLMENPCGAFASQKLLPAARESDTKRDDLTAAIGILVDQLRP